MKTSTKLIIILCLFVPVSLLAYNYILKTEFNKRNFLREYSPDATLTYLKHDLGSFRHIVINGSLKAGDGYTFTNWRPIISINSNPGNIGAGNKAEVMKSGQNQVHYNVRHDTLFVWFVTREIYKDSKDVYAWPSEVLRIKASGISSIDVKYAFVNMVDKPSAFDTLKLTMTGGGKYDLNKITVNKLTIMATDSSFFNINKGNRINTLYYSLLDRSLINLDEHPIHQFQAGRIDDSAKIQITDRALYLQKQLR